MPEKFKFTQDDLDKMILDALNQESGTTNTAQGNKPNAIQGLLAKAKLGKKQ